MLNNYPINAILLLCDYPFPNKVNVERLERKNLELDIFYIAQSTECLFQLRCNRKCDYIWNAIYCILHKFLLSRGPGPLPNNQ